MAVFEIIVPKNYADKVGGTRGQEQRVSINAKNAYLAKNELTKKWGIPWGVANYVSASEVPKGSTGTAGSLNLSSKANKKGNKEAVAFNEKFAVGADIGALSLSGPRIGGGGQATRAKEKDLNLGTEQVSGSGLTTGTPSGRTLSADTLKKLAGIGEKATSGSANQFLPDWLKKPEPKRFEPVVPLNKTKPEDMRTLFPQVEGGLEGTGAGLTAEQKATFDAFDVGSELGSSVDVTGADRTREERAGAPSTGDTLDTDQIIDMFYEDGPFGKATLGPPGEEIINPLLSSLLLAADSQANRVSFQQIADIEALSREQVALFNKDAAIEIARQNNLSDAEIARLTTEADTAIATAAKEVDKYIADQQLVGTQAHATATAAAAESARLGQEAAAESAAGATTAAAESMAGSQLGAAEAAAGAASPFGFMQQATTNDAQQTPEQQLKAIYDELNAVGLAQAGAANIGAQDNAFSFAAGQARNPVTGELDFDPNQIGQIAANTPAAFAAKGQEAAARAGATGFGALLSGNAAQQANANAILRAQAANNPYAMQQLGQGWAGTGAADQNARIDQILRGGLSAQQRLAEINASQSGQNFANQLNFMSNPSAVGFATEQGLFGGGNNQILQDINNSPEGNVPGSLFGFNSPSSAGAGGGQTTTVNTDNFNPNLSTFKNASPEQMGFYQGMQSAGGQTPREVQDSMESFTPQGL